MAQKAKKDRAKSNTSALNTLHLTSLIVNVLFLLLTLLFRPSSLILYALLSIPAFACEFILERSGRPTYTTSPSGISTLKTAGEDLAAQGLTEYMFDVVWVTWACLFAVLALGNWGWGLWTVVPVFAVWKGWGMLAGARGLMGGGQSQGIPQEQEQTPVGNRRSRRVAA